MATFGLACLPSRSQTLLSADDAVKRGLEKNPQIAASRAAAAAALATYRSLAVPQPITGGVTHLRSNDPSLERDYLLDLGETIDTSGQRRYQAAAANAQYKAAIATYEETKLSIEQQIRDAYWTLAANRAQTQLGKTSLQEAQRVFELTVKQEQAGSSPRSDVVRSSIDVANTKQALLSAQGAERTALIALNTLLARPPEMPIALADDFAREAVATPPLVIPAMSDLNIQAALHRPLLRSALEQSRAANYAVRQAEAARLPDLSVSYERSVFQHLNTYQLSISFPLLDFGSVSQSVRAAKELRNQAEAQQKQTEQQVAQQISQALSDLRVALDSASSYKKEILDPSATLLSMARLGYEQGATGILPIIDAESTLRSARIGYINSILAVYKAQDELLAAVGVLPTATPSVKK